MPCQRNSLQFHPGEILLAEFLEALALSQYRLSHDLSVSPRRINDIVHGKRAITADTALRLGRYFGTSAQFWLNLQTRYDLETEREGALHRASPFPVALWCFVVCSAFTAIPRWHAEALGVGK